MGLHNRESVFFLEKLKPAFVALNQSAFYASDTQSSIWEFAVSIKQLAELGCDESDLRWLVKKGLVGHGSEVTLRGYDGREFRSTGNLTFAETTCFVLTELGIEFTQNLFDIPGRSSAEKNIAPGQEHKSNSETYLPQWDEISRKLSFNGHLVKHFRWPAINQETILNAFEEEGWPDRIDDPLSPQPQQDPKRRLADTIKCLNRKQHENLLHFRGDGTGQGVLWETQAWN